ncbi:translation machinery-associated protein 20, partial [Coemansia sp. RSA 2705]
CHGSRDADVSVPPSYPEHPAAPAGTDDLRALGVAHAFRIRFEFQDLDAFPCIALRLPGDRGQVLVGPYTLPENLSTYLQPQWWAVWFSESANVHDTSPVALRQQFAGAVADGNCVQRCLLTRRLASDMWVLALVLSDGRLCLAVGDDADAADARALAEPPVVFELGAEAVDDPGPHVWLPTASPAVVTFDLQPMFKKFNLAENMNGKTQVKASAVRGIRSKLLEQFPKLEPHIDEILPKKATLVQIKCRERIVLYAMNNEILFFQHFDDPLTPTLHLLHRYPDILPHVQVDRGAIKFVLSGANI